MHCFFNSLTDTLLDQLKAAAADVFILKLVAEISCGGFDSFCVFQKKKYDLR